ncbi:hypothetical protein AB4Z40_28905 [Bosea sp. 2YAB26]|uniref:hypothetical protein n=1 Tax=Bosea sp. 2YAB26 TaxID=3237478 RepID=UPI003F903022
MDRAQAMKNVLTIAAVAEIATGLALLVVPSFVAQVLLGEELDGAALQIASIAGIALVALGIACWPGPPLLGMLIYSGAVALYLAYLDLTGASGGVLLWPAVIFHAVLTALLLRSIALAVRAAR